MSLAASRSRRIARVMAVGLSAVVLAACGSDDTGTDEPTETPTETPTTEQPAEPAALDPCALLDAATVSQTLGGEPLRVTSHSAAPIENGWQTTCGYGTLIGTYSTSVTVLTEIDPKTFPNGVSDKGNASEGKDGEPGELQPIEDLGDAAWTEVGVPPNEYASGTVTVHILRGDHGVRISSNYRADAEPNIDGTVELGRTALPELPAEFTIPPFDVEAPCSDVDTDLAAEATGSQVVASRSFVDGAELACEFALADGNISITAARGEEPVATFEEGKSYGVEVPDLGDAAFNMGDGLGSLNVLQGDQVITISAFAGGGATGEQLTEPQIAFVESVLTAVE